VNTMLRPAAGLHTLLAESLAPLGYIAVRRMFGGAGVFCDGLMFALVIDDVLYLKADDAGSAEFLAEGLAPFTYSRKGGRQIALSYWRAPERLLDEPDELVAWAGRALAAARRTAAKTKKSPERKSSARRGSRVGKSRSAPR